MTELDHAALLAASDAALAALEAGDLVIGDGTSDEPERTWDDQPHVYRWGRDADHQPAPVAAQVAAPVAPPPPPPQFVPPPSWSAPPPAPFAGQIFNGRLKVTQAPPQATRSAPQVPPEVTPPRVSHAAPLPDWAHRRASGPDPRMGCTLAKTHASANLARMPSTEGHDVTPLKL